MLRIETFTFNAFQENTLLIINDKGLCWIVDPGMNDTEETNSFFEYIRREGLKPQAIINTHSHLDHIFGVEACKNEYNIPFHLHELDLPVLRNAQASAMMFGFQFGVVPTVNSYIREGEPLVLGDDELEVRFTPGHSPGSVSFYYPAGKWVIGGDVLFNGSIGRTDLPGGSFEVLNNSIRRELFSLPEETTVFPGHGPTTTIGQEKQYNPFLQD